MIFCLNLAVPGLDSTARDGSASATFMVKRTYALRPGCRPGTPLGKIAICLGTLATSDGQSTAED
jgi:hypothetical protein